MRLSSNHSFQKARPLFNLTIFIILSFYILAQGSTPIYMENDLQYTDYDLLVSQMGEWYQDGDGNVVFICQNEYILATKPGSTYGYSVLERTYGPLQPHNTVFVTLNLSLIEGWSVNDKTYISIYGNGVLIEEFFLGYITIPWSSSASKICTSTGDIINITVQIQCQHNQGDMMIELKTYPDQSGMMGYVGIQDIQYLLSNETLTTSTLCTNSPYTKLFDPGTCSCPFNKYLDSATQACKSCDSSCGACSGPSSLECLSCPIGYTYNGTQCMKCDITCQTCFGTSAHECLTCYDTDILSWDNTCQTSCTAPLTSQLDLGYYSCLCPNNAFYYDQINTCNATATCTDPGFISSFRSPIYLCDFACPVGQYYYANGSCSSTCDPNYIPTGTDYKYCNLPCATGEYLFEDGQCLSSCKSPLISSTVDNVPLCNRPCTSPDIFYFPDEKTCRSSCPSPYSYDTADLSTSCTLVLSTSQQQEIETVNSVTDAATVATQGFITASVALSADPGGASSGMLSKALQYTKYMNISYSVSLEALFKSKNLTSGFIPYIIPPINEQLRDDFPVYPVPLRFSKFNVSSSFFVNFWEGLISISILVALWIVMKTLELLAYQFKVRFFPHPLLKTLRAAVQNFFITQFYTVYGDVILYSTLDMRTNQFDSFAAVGSFTLALTFLIMGAIIIITHIYILNRYQNLKLRASQKTSRSSRRNAYKMPQYLTKFIQDYQGLEIFYLSFKDASLIQQALFLFINIRNIMFYLTIGLLFEYPLIQAILLTTFSTSIIIYLLIKRPFKDIINLLQQVCAELMLFVVDICILSMAILDYKQSTSIDNRNNLSQVIIWISISLNFVPPVFIVAKAMKAGYLYMKYRGASKKPSNRNNPVIVINNDQSMLKQLDKSKASINTSPRQRNRVVMSKLKVVTNLKGQSVNETSKSRNTSYSKDNSIIETWNSKQLDNSYNQEEMIRAKKKEKLSPQLRQYRQKADSYREENNDSMDAHLEQPRSPIKRIKTRNLRTNKDGSLYIPKNLLTPTTPSSQPSSSQLKSASNLSIFRDNSELEH